jgi:peptidoglycan/LPS O-acetylase OafA/YrhL
MLGKPVSYTTTIPHAAALRVDDESHIAVAAEPRKFRRLSELDGIRGWASLAVLLRHVFWEAFGARHPTFRNALTAFPLSGTLAVSIFFVLSAEALSISYLVTHDRRSLTRLVVKRYSRLTIPILFACLLGFALMKLGLTWSTPAAHILGREDWLGRFLQFNPSFIGMLHYSLLDVYLDNGVSSYDPFLWTMSVEMLGSIVLFVLLFAAEHLKRTNVLLAVLSAALLADGSFLGCFMAGLLFARLRCQGVFDRLQARASIQLAGYLAIVIVGAAGAWLGLHNHEGRPMIVLAPLLLFVVFTNKSISAFFAYTTISQMLGRISFPLYLVQFSVLVSLMSFLVVTAAAHGALSSAVIWGIALLTIATSLLTAWLFLPVEQLTHRLSNRLALLLVK